MKNKKNQHIGSAVNNTIKIIGVFSVLVLLFWVCGCSKSECENDNVVVPDITKNSLDSVPLSNISETIFNDEEQYDVIEENEYYKLTGEKEGYYCLIYGSDGNIAKKEGPSVKLPRITVINGRYVKYTLQGGTGVSTQWGYYYDRETKRFSESFQWILAENNQMVAYADGRSVTVRDMFDADSYCKEITNFEHELADAVEPIVAVDFEGDKRIVITYLTGDDYREVKEVFGL